MSPLLTLTQTFEFRLVFQSVFVLAILLAVFSESSLHAQNQEKFRFSAWNTGLKSTAFANCRILVKAENFRRTSDNSSGMGERAATTHYEILRRQEYCRIVDVMVMVGEPGIKTVLELCYTDQYLHLQGNNVSDPALEPKLSASGCLDVKEVEFYPADGLLGPASLIFGVVSFSGDWQPRLAEFVDSDSQDPAFLDFGPIGKVTVLFANGVPNEIEHSFGSITRDTATRKINRIKRNHSEINVIRYSKIVWNAVSIGFIPESYTYDQYLIVDGNRQREHP